MRSLFFVLFIQNQLRVRVFRRRVFLLRHDSAENDSIIRVHLQDRPPLRERRGVCFLHRSTSSLHFEEWRQLQSRPGSLTRGFAERQSRILAIIMNGLHLASAMEPLLFFIQFKKKDNECC